jgi:hypothetical protein
MPNSTNADIVVSAEFDINKRIEELIVETAAEGAETLPDKGHPLAENFVRKIEGSYNVHRAKLDTDNAINLLYIAYNATPQGNGGIRVTISDLMGRLILAQQDSELKMRRAVEDSGKIIKSLNDMFEDWKEVRSTDDNDDLKSFLKEDMVDLAADIQKRAERIASELNAIATIYDGIIADTDTAANDAQTALAKRLEDKAALVKEINENNAQAAKLESLVVDLQASIEKYQAMANKYEKRAETAEERAFIMSIVRVGADMLTAAIPAITAGITASATGGASVVASAVASAAVSTPGQMTTREAATNPDDKTADEIEKKKEVIDAKADKATAEQKKVELEKKGEALVAQKIALEKDDTKTEETKKIEAETIAKHIVTNAKEIQDQKDKIAVATTALDAAQGALKALSTGMKELSQDQKNQASSLREMQMQMIEKVETYETAKREQTAELIKINALLQGQRTEEETIQLAIKSLNLSLSALKRMREIIVEMSFFFKSFGEFMAGIARNSAEQGDAVQTAIDHDSISKRFKRRIVKANNEFFVSQAAEWSATEIVSSKFVSNFNNGWSELNRLNGNYLYGDALKDFLLSAARTIEDIAADRAAASRAKIASLNEYRARIQSAKDA